MNISSIILAAGKGSRMRSSLPKVLHKIASKPLIGHIISTLKHLDTKNKVMVVGPDMQEVVNYARLEDGTINFALQEERLGTAHAVKIGLKLIDDQNDILVLYGDTPFIKPGTIKNMYDILQADKKTALVLLCFTPEKPSAYGRLIISKNNNLEEIVEFQDCTDDQKSINQCNSGIMLFNRKHLEKLLPQIKQDNSKKEFYLTDIVKLANQNGNNCKYLVIDHLEAIAINSQMELAEGEKSIQNKLRDHFLENGVSMVDPSTVYFSIDTVIEPGTAIEPNVVFGLGVVVKSNCTIKSFSYIEGATIGANTNIGPFARIRPGTLIEENVRIGNFVELKNSTISSKTKINHLTYIGDATVGQNVNIGAGTITCNYDGYNKYHTVISDGAFIGSNSSLVAPLKIGKCAIVGAGSIITQDIEEDAIAISRTPQKNLLGKAKEFRAQRVSDLNQKPNL